MKVPFLHKVLILAMFGGLVLIGCGGGGDDSGGGECLAGSSYCPGSSGGGEDPGGNNNTSTGPGGTTPPAENITANLVYNAPESNITSSNMGLFHIINPNEAEPPYLDNHTSIYSKHILYHNVPANIGHNLFDTLANKQGYYPNSDCLYTNASNPKACEYYTRYPTNINGIYLASVVFNQDAEISCEQDPDGMCDITLFVDADPAVYNHTNGGIPVNIFKDAFLADYYYDGDHNNVTMQDALSQVEQTAQQITLGIDSFVINQNLSVYTQTNETLLRYVDSLVDSGRNNSLIVHPPLNSLVEHYSVGLTYNGAYYSFEKENKFKEEESDPIDVNESDPTHPNYWLYSSATDVRGHEGDRSMITLCKRASKQKPDANATYTCEEGDGNVTGRWRILGKSINYFWQ